MAESESEVAQSCPSLCGPVNGSPPGFSVHGIVQARILEWVAISFSRGSFRPRSPALQADALPLSHQGSRAESEAELKRPGVLPSTGTHESEETERGN